MLFRYPDSDGLIGGPLFTGASLWRTIWSPFKEEAMLRTIALGTGVLTLGLGLATGVGGGIATAKTPPTQFSGDISCTASGSVNFNPKITNGGTSPETVSVKFKITGCSGAGDTDGAITLSKGTLKATTTVPVTNACEPILSGSDSLPAATGTISWKGHGGSIVTSTVSVASETLDYNAGANTLDVFLRTTTVSAGSFDGQHLTFGTFAAKKNPYKTVATCNGGGIKAVTVGSATATVGA